jgi:S-phase kinase-associated protein 1
MEGNSFSVPMEVAKMSEVVKSLIDEDADEDVSEVPLPKVKATILKKVIEFCQHYKAEPMKEIEKPLKSHKMADVVQKWYADFVDVEQVVLFELIQAANFMDIKPLLDLTCTKVTTMITKKTPEEIRAKFNIDNDFSPAEEREFRKENEWFEEA